MNPLNPPSVYTVLLVDDHPVTRLGLRWTFEREPDFEVRGEAGDIGAALDLLARQAPDLVVADLSLEGRSGLELVRQIRAYYPALPVLVYSMHDGRLYARRALQAGARAYVMKGGQPEEVLLAARAVLGEEAYADGRPYDVTDGAASELSDEVAALTDRELEVFLLLGQGYAPRHIAEDLCLSTSTVEAYRERLKAKLGIADSALLLRYAVRWLRDQERGTLT